MGKYRVRCNEEEQLCIEYSKGKKSLKMFFHDYEASGVFKFLFCYMILAEWFTHILYYSDWKCLSWNDSETKVVETRETTYWFEDDKEIEILGNTHREQLNKEKEKFTKVIAEWQS